MNGEKEHPVYGTSPGRGPGDAGPGAAPSRAAPAGGPASVPRNAAAARETVTRLLASRIHGPAGEGLAEVVVSDALLVTSELVTNAFRHGGGLTGFTAELTGEGLLLAVADASTDAPVASPTRRGQPMSEATAGRWCAVWRSGCPSRSIPAASASSP